MPEDYDPADFDRANRVGRDDRLQLGVIYRREPGTRPPAPGADYRQGAGVWKNR